MERGQVLAKPGSITPHTKFKGEVYVLTKEEGGRHTPFFTGYRPQFYFRTTDVTGTAELPDGVEMVMPGDNVTIDVNLLTPIAMDKGLRFAIPRGRAHGRGRHGHRDHRVGRDRASEREPRQELGTRDGEATMRDNVTLQCGDCKRRNYVTTKNKKTDHR